LLPPTPGRHRLCSVVTRVVISNYKSLGEDTDLRLGPLTALVGPNGSGKSNIADVFQFLADAVRQGLEWAVTRRGGFRGVGRWSGGRLFNTAIRVEIAEDAGHGAYELRLSSRTSGADYAIELEQASWTPNDGEPSTFEVVRGTWRGPGGLTPEVDDSSLALPLVAADTRFRRLAERLRSAAVYAIYPDVLRQPQKPDASQPMSEHGENWASVMREVLRSDASGDLKVAVHRVAGDIEDIQVESRGGFLFAQFLHEKSPETKRLKWFPALQESDGTLRIAGIVTALLQRPSPLMVGIEEPEMTIHPGMLPLLHDYLLEATSRSQVILTTHSPDLLSLLSADAIFVVERAEGVTTAARMAEEQQEAVAARLTSPGELLRLEGLQQEKPDAELASSQTLFDA
jgi:predicted ATPase